MGLVHRFERNEKGRDIAVADVHGHFKKLQKALDAIGFDPKVDRLFIAGDLVDRGPDCLDALDWLKRAHCVRGNHDNYVVQYIKGDSGKWISEGGVWFEPLSEQQKRLWLWHFYRLPLAIEVKTSRGTVGIIHADCVMPHWPDLMAELDGYEDLDCKRKKLIRNCCMWSRGRFELNDTTWVTGIRAVVVGHNPTNLPVVIANVHHIDTTAGYPQARFTFIDLETLQTFTAPFDYGWMMQ